MDFTLILILLVSLGVLAIVIWILILVTRLAGGRIPAPGMPTSVPRGTISTPDLTLLLGSPGAPGFPVSVSEPPDPDGDCVVALKLSPARPPLTAPPAYEFEIVCLGAACETGSRDCLLVWRRATDPPSAPYRLAGEHTASDALDVPLVWACGCGLRPEDIPSDCRALIQTITSSSAPPAFPLTGLNIDCDTPRCSSGAACTQVQYTNPTTGVRLIWCACLG